MTTTDRLHAAPFVAMVLSFAAVLGLGLFIGPVVVESPSPPSGSPRSTLGQQVPGQPLTPQNVTPQNVTPQNVTPQNVTPQKGTPQKGTPQKGTPQKGVPPTEPPATVTGPLVALAGPNGNGTVTLGPLARNGVFAPSSIDPSLAALSDSSLMLCVTTPREKAITDEGWTFQGKVSGLPRFCRSSAVGETITFTIRWA